MAAAEAFGVPEDGYEIQMLHGMGEPIQRALVGRGQAGPRLHALRGDAAGHGLPGAPAPGKHVERVVPEGQLHRRVPGSKTCCEIPRRSEPCGAGTVATPVQARADRPAAAPACRRSGTSRRPTSPGPRPAPRCARRSRRCGASSAASYPLVLGGREVATGETSSPRPTRAIRDASSAGSPRRAGRGGRRAVSIAREAFAAWSRTPAADRAAVLIRAAAIMRRRRFDLAAWEVYECGKPWREADGDVAEAIDFCEFYAREMIRLAEPRHRDVPGETNAIERIARGVAVVIPPWNFPLAIPTGMTVAALVTGNTVVLKPSERSPMMAPLLAEILREAGLPDGRADRPARLRRRRPGPGRRIPRST